MTEQIDDKSLDRIHKGYKRGSSDWKAQLDMLLPDGVTCADCVHENRCNIMFKGNSKNTSCQFYPTRFKKRI